MQKNRKKICKYLIFVSIITFLIDNNFVFAANTLNCNEIPRTMALITEILGYVKIFIPVLLILLGSIDFIKAAVAQNDDKMKKAQGDFVKRLIIGVVIFFVPLILRFILNISGFGNDCLDQILRF